jgi:DNA polymerase-4
MADLDRPAAVEDGVASVLDDVWSYCERIGIVGRTVTVKIKYADFQIVTRSRTLPEGVGSRDLLERTARELVRSVFPLEKKVRLLGVSLHNLQQRAEPRVPPQMTLAL